MSRIALLCSERLRSRMGGIGIRYVEMARRLLRDGLDVVVLATGDVSEVPADLGARATVRAFERGRLCELTADCDGGVAQGYLANDLLVECPHLPVAVDLYDPFLLENLHYTEALGLDCYRNDHATWVLQLSRGDFFLCSTEAQRDFYLGFLAALGRANPHRVAVDPSLDQLIAVVPFGVPGEVPEHRPVLGPATRDGKRILFGGLYDWYDPWTLLRALESLDRPGWSLLFVRNPNPEETPQRLREEVMSWCATRGWHDGRVEWIDWVAADRRFDLLRDVDLLVTTHEPSLETRYSYRTRILDALAVACPVVLTSGGAMGEQVDRAGGGWTVPPGDVATLAAKLGEVLDGCALESNEDRRREFLAAHSWDAVFEPLVEFCRSPRADGTKASFVANVPTVAPMDRWATRLRRYLERRRRAR